MFCTRCGRDIPDGAAFCAGCGAPVTASTAGAPSSAESGIDEIGLFVGKDADYYKTQFRKFNIRGVETFAPTWNWWAFGANFWWMLYRKLYLWAFLWFILTFIPIFGIAFWIAAGLSGNYLYYRHAVAKIRDAKRGRPADQLPAILTELGGVNGWVIPVAVIVSAGLLILLILFGLGMGLFCYVPRRVIGI